MVKLKSIGVWSMAKYYMVISAIIGLFYGIIIAIFGSILAATAAITGAKVGFLLSLGALAIIVCPIFFGIMGLLGGAVSTWIFNIVLKITKGIDMEFEE